LRAALNVTLAQYIEGFEIGNEVDTYPGGKRPANWSYADYDAELRMYMADLAPVVGVSRIQGGTYASKAAFTGNFPDMCTRYRCDSPVHMHTKLLILLHSRAVLQ
jgi:hypothetical protein